MTNTRTKSLVKLGLDYDTLKEKFPKLISPRSWDTVKRDRKRIQRAST